MIRLKLTIINNGNKNCLLEDNEVMQEFEFLLRIIKYIYSGRMTVLSYKSKNRRDRAEISIRKAN
jgi:hypothetical protein